MRVAAPAFSFFRFFSSLVYIFRLWEKRVHRARPSTLDKQNTHSSNAAVAIAFAIGTDGGKGIVLYGENYGGVCFGML